MVARKDQAKLIEVDLLRVAGEVVGKVQLRCQQVLILANPVDTGFSRSQWTPSVGSPVAERRDRPQNKKSARTLAYQQQAENAAKARLIAAGYKVSLGPAFLTNATSYIVPLNEGSSAQAPAKWVERALETAVRSFGGKRL